MGLLVERPTIPRCELAVGGSPKVVIPLDEPTVDLRGVLATYPDVDVFVCAPVDDA